MKRRLTGCLGLLLPLAAHAGGIPTTVLEEVTVFGERLQELRGAPVAASEGLVSEEQLANRPVLRTGELLETVPGLIVTQHSGDGKANQFFLRGFNLDHGTDLATSVDGVPVNMPSHGHGQGYTDINFVIPELLQSIGYRKGVYYAETGNFSAAGAIDLRYRDTLNAPLAQLEIGEHEYLRGVLAGSQRIGDGTLLAAVEYANIDGPWRLEEDYRKVNGVVRYSRELDAGRLRITAQGYDGDWRSTDQIPMRAVQSGELDRFGFVDPTSGGASHRYSLALDAQTALGGGETSVLVYALDYRLRLVSNFTYFTAGANGDQFEQADDRKVYGGEWSWRRGFTALRRSHEFTAGTQLRRDDIGAVGLYQTANGRRVATVREDSVAQTSAALYTSLETQWTDFVRTTVGLRADHFRFKVESAVAENSGQRDDAMASPKFALVLGPWRATEFFANVGRGFHSNDARGTTLQVDPADPLVSALGAELGLRTAILPNTQLSVALWSLDLDSELLFVGDAGTTEASRSSRRRGLELAAIWNPMEWLIVDADAAWSRARFGGVDPAGNRVPGAVENVLSLGVAVDDPRGWSGGARIRHLGAAPLIENDSVRSKATTLVNVEAGYRISPTLKASVAMYNVFNRADNDITYFYESQLANESSPVADIHFHPVEPRTVRLTVTSSF